MVLTMLLDFNTVRHYEDVFELPVR
jgi:hypothetical protein